MTVCVSVVLKVRLVLSVLAARSLEKARACLRCASLAVDIAENGQVAMDKLSRAWRKKLISYGLILTDIYMPKVRGFAASSCCSFRRAGTAPSACAPQWHALHVVDIVLRLQVDGAASSETMPQTARFIACTGARAPVQSSSINFLNSAALVEPCCAACMCSLASLQAGHPQPQQMYLGSVS